MPTPLGTLAEGDAMHLMKMQCDDIDVMLRDAMSGELMDSTPDSWGYRPKEKRE